MLQFYDGTQWSGSQSSGCVPQPNTPSLYLHEGASGTTIRLNGTKPAPGISGKWIILSGIGGSFAEDSVYNTTFTGINDYIYTLQWNLMSAC
ncbi:hypothetical protein ACFLSA_00215 [Bacteroidota bacterium]